MLFRNIVSRALGATPLGYLPVRVRTGPAKGARWTLGPHSNNWRHGGEGDLAAGLRFLPQPKGSVFWDFGAHFGIHTIGMAMTTGDSGQVCAFEPDPVAFRRLKYHVGINKLQNVRLFPVAVSAVAERKRLIVSHGLGTSFSHFRYEDEVEDEDTTTLEVETVVPDELVTRGEIRAPDLIKVDVQGHGAKALAGSTEAIRAKAPVIVFSNHSKWEMEGTRALLDTLGYRVYALSGELVDWDWLSTHDTAVLVRAT